MEETTRVLLVEDNLTDAEFVREILQDVEGQQFTFRHVHRLEEALSNIRDHQVDAVLLDLGLPDTQGLGTLDRMLQEFPSLPVIVLTGLDDHQIGMDAIHRGAQDYIVKGRFEAESLRRAIHYAIDRQTSFNLLQEHLEFQQQMLNALPTPLFYLDADLVIIGCNVAFEAIVGRTRDDLLGRGPGEVFPNGLKERFESAVSEKTGEVTPEIPVTLIDANGTQHSLVMRHSVIRDGDDHPKGMVVILVPKASAQDDAK